MKSARSRIVIGIGMCAMVSLLGSNAVFAQEAELRAPLVKKEAESLWQTLGFKISGATDVTYTQNFNNPSNNVNNMRIFDTQANSFVPQVAQLVFEKPTSAGSAYDRVGFRARLSWGAQARFSRARTNYQPGNDNAEFDPQEIYGEYLAPLGNGLKIQVGKIHTLVGLEQINSWDNYNISRTFMFGLSQAFTTTGIRFTYPINKYATVAMGLVNGWDNIEDNNRGKTFEWGVFLTPHDRLSATFYGTYGAEQGNGNNIGGFAAAGACVQGTTGCDPTAKRLVAGAIITVATRPDRSQSVPGVSRSDAHRGVRGVAERSLAPLRRSRPPARANGARRQPHLLRKHSRRTIRNSRHRTGCTRRFGGVCQRGTSAIASRACRRSCAEGFHGSASGNVL